MSEVKTVLQEAVAYILEDFEDVTEREALIALSVYMRAYREGVISERES